METLSNKNKQYLILVVGHNASGKSTLTKQIINTFPYINRINGDVVRAFLAQEISYYKDILQRQSKKNVEANKSINLFLDSLTTELLNSGQSVVIDRCGLTRTQRKHYLSNADDSVTTILIDCNAPEEVLLQRLTERDIQTPQYGWVERYIKTRKNKGNS